LCHKPTTAYRYTAIGGCDVLRVGLRSSESVMPIAALVRGLLSVAVADWKLRIGT
jgi:hypothetical protein